MSENTSDSYEVGYGKPPKNTQFRKGVSGNPKGRPKKPLDFEHELLRESRSFITINENGCRRRISKHSAVLKQLTHKAMSGNVPAARTYLALCQVAFEKLALLEASESSGPRKYDGVSTLTDEELVKIINAGPKDKE
jgi:hypothetical protein